MTALESVRSRIAEASAALERLTTEPMAPRDASGMIIQPSTDRYRLLSWLGDLRREEASLARPLPEFLRK